MMKQVNRTPTEEGPEFQEYMTPKKLGEGAVKSARAVGKASLGLVSHAMAAGRLAAILPDMMTLGALGENFPGFKSFTVEQGTKSASEFDQGKERFREAAHSAKLAGIKFKQAFLMATGQK